MRIFIGFVFLAIFLYAGKPLHASVAPPAKVTEVEGNLSCLAVEPTWMSGQPARWGTFRKGPAIRLSNHCSNDILVEKISYTKDDPEVVLQEQFVIEKQRDVLSWLGDFRVYFSNNSDPCTDKNRIDKREARPPCGKINLSVGHRLLIPVQWETRFDIRGEHLRKEYLFFDKPVPFHLTGKMINPDAPIYLIAYNLTAAEAGDIGSQMIVAHAYHEQGGVDSFEKSTYWYRRAYEEGKNANAARTLGALYQELDPSESFAWYKRAAELGDSFARCTVAESYATGKNVPLDKEQALTWQLKQHDISALIVAAKAREQVAEAKLNEMLRYARCNYGAYTQEIEGKTVDWYLVEGETPLSTLP